MCQTKRTKAKNQSRGCVFGSDSLDQILKKKKVKAGKKTNEFSHNFVKKKNLQIFLESSFARTMLAGDDSPEHYRCTVKSPLKLQIKKWEQCDLKSVRPGWECKIDQKCDVKGENKTEGEEDLWEDIGFPIVPNLPLLMVEDAHRVCQWMLDVLVIDGKGLDAYFLSLHLIWKVYCKTGRETGKLLSSGYVNACMWLSQKFCRERNETGYMENPENFDCMRPVYWDNYLCFTSRYEPPKKLEKKRKRKTLNSYKALLISRPEMLFMEKQVLEWCGYRLWQETHYSVATDLFLGCCQENFGFGGSVFAVIHKYTELKSDNDADEETTQVTKILKSFPYIFKMWNIIRLLSVLVTLVDVEHDFDRNQLAASVGWVIFLKALEVAEDISGTKLPCFRNCVKCTLDKNTELWWTAVRLTTKAKKMLSTEKFFIRHISQKLGIK